MNDRFLKSFIDDLQFTRPGTPLKSWGILSLDRFIDERAMQSFVTQLVAVLQQAGCPVANQRPVLKHENPDNGGPNAGIKAALGTMARDVYKANSADPQLVIVILPVSSVLQQIRHSLIFWRRGRTPFCTRL